MRNRVTAAVALACFAASAGAADWTFDPKITVNAESNDNNRLTDVPGEEIEVSGAEVDAQFTLQGRTPRSTFRLMPRLRSTIYPGDEQDESDNQYLRADLAYRGERSETRIDAAYQRETILGRFFPGAAVRDDDVLGEPGRGDDVARVDGKNRQERFEIEPKARIKLTERTDLQLGAGYMDVGYDRQETDDREDYADTYVFAGLGFRLSPTSAISILGHASRFEPDNDISTDAQGLNAEWSNNISETSQVFVRGGVSRVESGDAGSSDWNNGFTGGAGVRWRFEVTQLFVDYNRYLDPNGLGRIVERDQLRAEMSRQLGPRTDIKLGLRAIRDGRATEEDTFEDRTYAAATIGFSWRFTRQFTLGTGYRYAWREYENAATDAESNQFFLGVTYEPNRR